ncbi:MAG: hypothetical protein IK075_04200 [Prevotella sp.]|nr:hypothetical protein [Prevotella sp.]
MSELEPLIADLIVLVIIFGIAFSPRLRKRSEQINQTFTENLAQRS